MDPEQRPAPPSADPPSPSPEVEFPNRITPEERKKGRINRPQTENPREEDESQKA